MKNEKKALYILFVIKVRGLNISKWKSALIKLLSLKAKNYW